MTQDALCRLGETLDAEASYPGGDTYRKAFEEYMREREFGLALEVICDYLVTHGSVLIDPSNMAIIEELHAEMGVRDDCVHRLQKACSQSGRKPC